LHVFTAHAHIVRVTNNSCPISSVYAQNYLGFSLNRYIIENRIRAKFGLKTLSPEAIRLMREKFFITQYFTQTTKIQGILSLAMFSVNLGVGVNNDFYAAELSSTDANGFPRYLLLLWFAFIHFLMELSTEHCSRKCNLSMIEEQLKEVRHESEVSQKKSRRQSLKTEALMEFRTITKGVSTLLNDWEMLNSCVIWNIVVVQDLHIASRSVRWFCDKQSLAVPITLSGISLFGCVTIMALYFMCQVGHGISERSGENGPLGVLLPYLDIGNPRYADAEQRRVRNNSKSVSWFSNPLHDLES
jgi:hypothetical protein